MISLLADADTVHDGGSAVLGQSGRPTLHFCTVILLVLQYKLASAQACSEPVSESDWREPAQAWRVASGVIGIREVEKLEPAAKEE